MRGSRSGRGAVAARGREFFSGAVWGEAVRHLPLIRRVAEKYAGRGCELDDLMQEGLFGACRAVEGYDPSRGVPFSAYAGMRIQAAIVNAIRRTRHVTSFGDLPGDPPESTDDADPSERLLRDDEIQQARAEVRRLLRLLDARQRRIVSERFGLDGEPPREFLEIARGLGLSRPYVGLVCSGALDEMRAATVTWKHQPADRTALKH